MIKKLLFFGIALIFLSSCTQRSLRYIQDKEQDKLDTVAEYSNQPPDYKIQPYDVLYIKITTLNQEINTLFEENVTSNYTQNINNSYNNNNDANFYFTGFMVTDTGWVKVPLLGDFYVKNKTIDEIEILVNKKVNELLIDAIVKVKLISFKVFYLGEFNNQGTYANSQTFYQKNVNLLEAISAVGGINDYGDKRRVMIIRKSQQGFNVFRVDLTQRNILESEQFYLQPNDMIYVEPVKSKGFRLALADYMLPISAISSTISTIVLILSLTK